MSRDFLSDTSAGAHPEVLSAIVAANAERVAAYGGDPHTAAAVAAIRQHFGADASVFFVFGGTAANVVALQAVARPHHAVVCTDQAHVHTDEAGALEHVAGCKLLVSPSVAGKLTSDAVAAHLGWLGDVHRPQPRVVSLTQATEVGTVYRPDEIRALADLAHASGLVVHMDGARLANAAAFLDLPLRALTVDAGVDIVSFGGTKNGLLGAEAVIAFPSIDAGELPWIRKQNLQLAAKMRFLAVQFEALMRDDLWLRSARQANDMARRLADGLAPLAGVEIALPVEANGVFARLPPELAAHLRSNGFLFHAWDESASLYRLMTTFSTTPEEVDALVESACSFSVQLVST